MNLKEFACLDKHYLSKKERKTYIIIYGIVTVITSLLPIMTKIDIMTTAGIIFIEGIIATLILYKICKNRIDPNDNKCGVL